MIGTYNDMLFSKPNDFAVMALDNIFTKLPVDEAMIDEFNSQYRWLNGKCSVCYVIMHVIGKVVAKCQERNDPSSLERVVSASRRLMELAFDYSLLHECEKRHLGFFIKETKELLEIYLKPDKMSPVKRNNKIYWLSLQIDMAEYALKKITESKPEKKKS